MKKRILSFILAMVMVLGMFPATALADEPALGSVQVIVENTTFTEAVDGTEPAWTGELVNTTVDLTEDATMMSCVAAALSGYSVSGINNNYISKINGLGQYDGGSKSGWMGTLNDWFVNYGFADFSVADGDLEDGDLIRVMYTCDLGVDLGSEFSNTDKTVKALSFDAGTLDPAFDKDTHAYTLTVPADTTGVVVTPTASNKNFQVHTYVGDTEYKRTATVPVEDGSVITVKCGDPNWPAMSENSGEAQVYTITVAVEAGQDPAPSTAWDGETKTEPQSDSDGVYQIGTGAELAWFVNEYSANNTAVTGVLTADIDLGEKEWLSSGNTAYNAFRLDGQNHKITGLNATHGLIYKVFEGSEIKNLTVYGSVSSTETYAGGIVSYAVHNVTLENCVNYATVSGTSNVGGVVGYVGVTNGKTFIMKNCANYGTVTGSGTYVGGIIGYLSCNGNGATITGCYNTADVTGSNKYVGGLMGYAEKKNVSITGCYNTGAVAGTDIVGGLLGYAKGSNKTTLVNVSNCYSTGTASGTGSNVYPLFGQSASVGAGTYSLAVTNAYYLSDHGTDRWGGTGVTAEELKTGLELDTTYFKVTCGGYPALVWQTDVKEHTADSSTVTAPTCTEGGYTTYTCSDCGESYQADQTAALGHLYCDHAATETCDHCEAQGNTLVRTCQRGCSATTSEDIHTTYTVTLPTDATGYAVTAASGYDTTVIEGESFAFTVTIASGYKKGEEFAVKANDTVLTEESGVYTIENITANQTITVTGVEEQTNGDKGMTIIAPAGSTITAGRFHSYYKYDISEPLETGTYEDGRVYAIYTVPGSQAFYRVQNPDGVTYWSFNKSSGGYAAGKVYEVTGEMLHMDDETFTKSTVYTDFSQNSLDKADIYLNVNAQGYLTLNTGDTNNTYELNVFRNWMALDNSTMNTGVALPDVTYTVISADGTASDVVTVTPDTVNSCVATVTANKAGTAIILVTYDAMTNASGLGGTQFSAIWPENTGVIVVSVDENTGAITTNMNVNETVNTAYSKTALDAEHDILFYVGNAGATFSFTPESGCTVTVARSTVDTAMTFDGFTADGVTVADDGTVTVSGLTTGAHIIKVTKGDAVTYQVVRARQVSYTVTNADGEAITAENPAQPGETVTVQFSGLISPMEKLSGIYNSNFGFYYNGQDGTELRTVGGYYGVYDFSGNSSRQKFTFTIPESWNAATYTLTDGAIKCGGFGSFAGAHRDVTYAAGKGANTSAASINGILSVLPDIVIPTAYETSVHTVSFQVKKDTTYNSFVGFLKLYSWDGTEKGTEIDLGEKVDGLYTVELAEGTYWVEGYDCKETQERLGGMTLTVTEDASYIIRHGAKISVTNSGWVYGTDYTASATLSGPGGENRVTELGTREAAYEGITCIYAVGDTITVTFTSLREDFVGDPAVYTVTPNANSTCQSRIQTAFVPKHTISVTVPEGSVVTGGYLRDYNIYEYVEPVETTATTASFLLSEVSGTNIYASTGLNTHFIRVQHPDGVTYWMFGQWNAETEMTVSEDDLHLNDTVTSSTVVRDFSNNALDLANIYLNINEKGFLTMEAGKTKELNVWRTWQPIESINNAEIAVPDVHYTILKTDGTVDTTNSVVSITPDTNNSAQATLKAEGAGTAIVLVTYDAVTHDNAMTTPAGEQAQTTFSAIWPENTGVFVVTVGEGLDLSMTMDRPSTDKTTSLDGELDMLYYVGEAGASYTFAPGSGAEVKVARSTISDGKLSFSGFTAQGVSTDESGNVTVSGLTTGRHIIQVTMDGKTAYQVIAARQTEVTITHADGSAVTAENPAVPAEEVTVQFTGLINPVEKIAGIYNNTTYLYYETADGTSFVSGSGAFGGTYNFNSSAAQQSLIITIPRYFDGTSLELVGSMTTSGYGAAPGGHRNYRYGTKGSNSQNNPTTGGDLCVLPQLSIATKSVSYVNCTVVLKDGEQTLPLTGRTVTIYDVDGTAQTMSETGAIALPAGEYTYEVSGTGIRYASGSFTVTAETTEIVLAVEQTAANAWDGSTETEPAKDSDGVYQISNGAELAWFVKNVAAATAELSGVLTADIDLSDYAWTYVSAAWSDPTVSTKLDGQNHTVSGLRGKVSFLSKLGSGSEIKNLTVEGAISGAGSLGGIATSATGTVLENCVSRVEITSTGAANGGLVGTAKDVTIRNCANEGNITASGSSNNTGGLVGYGNTSGYVVIENSRNDGNITASASASYAGGILGSTQGAKTDNRIVGCVNTGSVYTGNYSGGIVGYVTSKMELTDCYNTGAITAKEGNYSGGIAGDFGGYYNWFSGADPDAAAQMTNCYSIDPNASKAIVGNVWQPTTVTYTNCVYLEGLNEDPNATAMTSAQLKAYAPEGSLFVEVCGGYPALSWETGKQAHSFCDHPVTETCEHCEYDPAPTAEAVGTLKRHCQNEGCDAVRTEEVPKLNTYTVTLPTGTGYTAAAVEGSASPVVEGGSYSFTVTIADGYEKGESFAVKANGTALTAGEDGSYTISNIKADQTVTVEGVEETPVVTWQDVLANAQTYLVNQGEKTTPEVGSQKGEWLILGLARNGVDADFYDGYYDNVVQYVKDNINDASQLNSRISTDNSRVILALSALGKDVTNVGGYDLIKGLSDLDYITSQGINGPVFALIALDSGDYDEPVEGLREDVIDYLLDHQLSGGGWGLDSEPDDMTPMAIQALAPYYESDDDVKAAVDKALGVMKSMVATTNNAESLAQMVVALSALKLDCETTEGFEDVLDKLLSYAVSDGQKGFCHLSGGKTNQMATEQSFYALVAYNRMKQSKTSLYDMTDVVTKKTQYTITVAACDHGTVTASASKAAAGTTVTLTVTPDTGFQLDQLTVTQEGGKAVTVTNNTFVMPEGNVTVEATFVQSENPAQDVIDAIDALNVTKADAKTQKQLEAVEAAYDNLSDEDQKKVTNYDHLLAQRAKFDQLLEDAKDDALDEVEQIVEKLNKDDYTSENWQAIRELVETVQKKIQAAENTDELDTLLSFFQWELDEIPTGDKITVTFRLIGDSLHDEASKHESYVTWIPTTTYTMEPGSTMYDVFVQAIADNGMSQQGAANNYVSTIKAPSVLGGYWLGEFDNGRNSGWMYTVNGSHPSLGLCEYELQDGDRIVWHYVDDYTVEEYKFTWLEAEDISPEEYVKKHGKDETTDVESFTDVNKSDWFYDDVAYVVENGLMNGTGDNKFSPNDSMNRAMLVTVLYRLEGEPKVSGTSEFTDVEKNQWYTNAVIWATKNEIVNGYGDGKFGPTDSITREQMATILFRYAQYKNYSTTASNVLTGYTDFSEISVYALKSLKWANAEGLITGRTATTLAPQGTATRAEVAAILHRFVENVVKG